MTPAREAASASTDARAPAPLPRAAVLRIVIGLLPAMFLAALDQTIVAIALVSIADKRGRVDLMPWVLGGYLVASTIATPIYGKLADLFGRWPVLATAISIFVAGAALSTVAPSMPLLLASRLLQGLGGGGLIAIVQAIVADVAPGPERGRYQGYLAGVFAVAAVAGPLVGGVLAEYLSWRAVFGINVPLGIAALLLARRAARPLPIVRRARPIDYAGALLLGIALGTLMSALTRLGQGHALAEPLVQVLFGVFAIALAGLVVRERRAPEPILPPGLFARRIVVLSCAITGLSFVLMVGLSVMLPIALQTLGGLRADQVALRLVALTLAVPVGAFVSGRLMWRIGNLRAIMLTGTALATLGTLALARLPFDSPSMLYAATALAGLGVGLTIPPTVVAPQEAVPRAQVGIVTATTALFRTLGGAIGIAVLGAILFGALGIASGRADAGALQALPAPALASAFTRVFASAAAFAALAFALSFAMPARAMRSAS